jgi:uroporphyrinogen-III synthase
VYSRGNAAETAIAQPAAMTPSVLAQQPLLGCTVAVTADRRREDLAALLRRRGARVLEAPTLKLVPLEDDAELRAATRACIDDPPDYVVATTGRGWRGWISAAEGWGDARELQLALGRATLVSRGPKATGAVRASGMREQYSAESELCSEVLAWLRTRDVRGKRIAVQQYGAVDPTSDCDLSAELRSAGADVITVPVYRWDPPDDRAAVDRLIDAIEKREVHAVAFTSAPGVSALLEAAAARDPESGAERVLEALRTDVIAACVGHICAKPLHENGVPTVRPDRARLGALAAELCIAVPQRVRREIPAEDGRILTIQGSAVLVRDEAVILPPVVAAVLAELAQRPGWVVSRAELLRRVWRSRGTGLTPGPASVRDQHIVESTIARLRTALGEDADLIRTVTKRGYRLAVTPTAG